MGLLRGIARTAAIAGTATAVSNRVSRRQAGRWAAKEQQADQQPAQDAQAEPQYAQQQPPQQYAQPQYAQPQYAQPQYAQPQYAPPPAAASTDDMLGQLKKLGELKDAGRRRLRSSPDDRSYSGRTSRESIRCAAGTAFPGVRSTHDRHRAGERPLRTVRGGL